MQTLTSLRRYLEYLVLYKHSFRWKILKYSILQTSWLLNLYDDSFEEQSILNHSLILGTISGLLLHEPTRLYELLVPLHIYLNGILLYSKWSRYPSLPNFFKLTHIPHNLNTSMGIQCRRTMERCILQEMDFGHTFCKRWMISFFHLRDCTFILWTVENQAARLPENFQGCSKQSIARHSMATWLQGSK